jgi:chromosome segregation ATPase
MSADTKGDASGDGRWMTYADIAKLRGISKASAERLVFRRRWRRQQGNDRILRVLVPLEFLSGDASGDISDDAYGAWAGALANLEKVATVLREQLDQSNQQTHEANKRADVAVALADRTLAQLAEMNARADRAEQSIETERGRAGRAETRADRAEQALSEERARADQAEIALDKLESELEAEKLGSAEVQAAMAELRQAEANRRGQGRWARLKAAWRGE